MRQYLDIAEKILRNGTVKHNRTGVDALTIPFVNFNHDMADGFPLVTTRKIFTKGVWVELEGFLRGITSKQWYQERGCKLWNEWANPEETKLQHDYMIEHATEQGLLAVPPLKEYQKSVDDLGPIYGYQWRAMGSGYNQEYSSYKGVITGFDQLKAILTSLKNNPTDRRMVCSAWNPGQHHLMALPPCHVLWNVVVINDTINLGWFQRSCDFILGVPSNIASYATLLLLLAKHSGLKPGVLNGTLADCHIYVNHLDGVKEQLKREPKPLPQCNITIDQPFDLSQQDIVRWTHKDVVLENYDPHPPIRFEVAV